MKDWRSTLVPPEASLETAVRTMDESGLRVALVVGNERTLLGIVTDGDVRRALLRNLPMSCPVRDVMCGAPQCAELGWSRERILALMQDYELIHVPIVDELGQIVGLETLHRVLERPVRDNAVFIMAGGFGTRLHPLTENCPKPMLKVGGRPILQILLETLVREGFRKFFFSTHYLPEVIKQHFKDGSDWGVSITYVHEDEPLGTGGALHLLSRFNIDKPLLVVNGDLLTTVDYLQLLAFHTESNSFATVCAGRYEHKVPYGVIEFSGDRLLKMVEKPSCVSMINAGIYVLSPEFLCLVPDGARIDMPSLLQQAIAEEQKVSVFPLHEYWLDIGRPEDFSRAQVDVQRIIYD